MFLDDSQEEMHTYALIYVAILSLGADDVANPVL